MIDVIYEGIHCYCLPDCSCCKYCHKRLNDINECPLNEDHCDSDCEYYDEIWDENELKAELEKDEDKEMDET